MASSATARDCTPLETFDAGADWRAVNDGVMGGRSSGGPRMAGGEMVFSGVINTNGGGFSSVRREVSGDELAGSDGLMLRVKTDGRAYRVNLRTAARFRGRSIAYQAPIDAGDGGNWQAVFVAWDDFRPSVFGQRVPAPPIDPSTAWSLGLIIADGRDGAFEMSVSEIAVCRARTEV